VAKREKGPPTRATTHGLHASKQVVAERIEHIADIMRRGLWRPGESHKPLCVEWGISSSRIFQMTAEAWRRVCYEANDPAAMRPEIAGILRQNMARADAQQKYQAVAKLADTWTKVIGARAPVKHEHAHVVAQFEQLDTRGKLAWIEERIAKLEEARRTLLAQEKSTLLLQGTVEQ